MYRLLALLALAVSSVGCSACGGPGYGSLWGCGSTCGCADECGCGCEAPFSCGEECCDSGCCDDGYCDDGCCGDCGCEPACGCSSDQSGGCCLRQVFRDCPLCQGSCCMFRRWGCNGCYDQCSQCGNCYDCGPCEADYDYSACNQCNGRGCCVCGGCCPGQCCETYTGCPCQTQGPGCCASGDHQYNFNPGPPTGQTAYPYYTVRGPRDFLLAKPPSIGPY
jgi:hypothetical protein